MNTARLVGVLIVVAMAAYCRTVVAEEPGLYELAITVDVPAARVVGRAIVYVPAATTLSVWRGDLRITSR